MPIWIVRIIWIYCFLLMSFTGNAQKILLLEVKNQVEAIRYLPGDVLIYKAFNSKDWQERRIERFILESNIILFEDDMISIDEISKVRVNNQVARAVGKLMTGFGMSWLIYSGVLIAAGRESFSWTNLAIGGVSIGLGQVFTKIAGRRNYSLGKYTRLRLVDISFPMPKTSSKIPSTP